MNRPPFEREAHAARALPHVALPPPRVAAAALLGLLALAACRRDSSSGAAQAGASTASRAPVSAVPADASPAAQAVTAAELPRADPAALQRVEALVRELAPPARQQTSDSYDQWIERRKQLLSAHAQQDEALGIACWQRLTAEPPVPDEVARDLLEIASRTAPALSAARLAECFEDYSRDIGLRRKAIELLASCAPELALEHLDTLVVTPRRSKTYPPQEGLLQSWLAAMAALERAPGAALSRIATDIYQDEATRHLAVKELGRLEAAQSRAALESVLTESTGDGYLRRLAAQSLLSSLGSEGACALLRRCLEHESDENFAYFLDDMVRKRCP